MGGEHGVSEVKPLDARHATIVHMLEAQGYKVVDVKRLALLEQISTQAMEVCLAAEQNHSGDFIVHGDELRELDRLCRTTNPQPYAKVDAKRLAALELLYADVKNWRYGLVDKVLGGKAGIESTYPAIYRLANTFDEIEWAFKVEALGDKP